MGMVGRALFELVEEGTESEFAKNGTHSGIAEGARFLESQRETLPGIAEEMGFRN